MRHTPGALGSPSMVRGDIAEVARAKSVHHRFHFVDRVPAQPAFERSDRFEARARIDLAWASSVKRWDLVELPLSTDRFNQASADDSQLGIACELGEEPFDIVSFEQEVRIEADNI